MPVKADTPVEAPAEAASPAGHAWRAHVDSDPEYNPFASTGVAGDGRTQVEPIAAEPPAIRDATVDTSPLEGTRDLSDPDSLEDVLANRG